MRAKVEAADAVFPRALKTPPENEINLVGGSGSRKVRQWREPAACNFRYRGRFSRMRRLNRGSAARGKMTSGAKTAAAGPFWARLAAGFCPKRYSASRLAHLV